MTTQQKMGTFLPPIENPEDPVLKQIYEMSQGRWCKVLTPIKVFNARMPLEFGQFAGKIAELDQTLTLPEGDHFPRPRARGKRQHLLLLHGHRPRSHDQGIHEPSQI